MRLAWLPEGGEPWTAAAAGPALSLLRPDARVPSCRFSPSALAWCLVVETPPQGCPAAGGGSSPFSTDTAGVGALVAVCVSVGGRRGRGAGCEVVRASVAVFEIVGRPAQL